LTKPFWKSRNWFLGRLRPKFNWEGCVFVKVFESIVRKGNNIYCKTAKGSVDVSERKKRIGMEGCIWDPILNSTFLQEGEWIVSEDKFVRAGVSAVVLNLEEKSVILSRFDSGHPTAADKLTPPAGLWDSNSSLKKTALDELGEEVILTAEDYHGYWFYKEQRLAVNWVKRYAEENGYKELFHMGWEIIDMETDRNDIFDIYLDDEYQGKAMIAAEFDTGSIELLFLFQINSLPMNIVMKDGEFFKSWLNREVGWFTKKQMIEERENLTTKAQKIIELL
jgi:hypothetical protein